MIISFLNNKSKIGSGIQDHLASTSTQLYSNKAKSYNQYRPDYAQEAVSDFKVLSNLPKSTVVMDVGSGTGTLTRHLLEHFDTVYAVEPTNEMREIAEKHLSSFPGFFSVAEQAENTLLPDNSVELITVGQAIHWFQPELTLAEFQRIGMFTTWLLLANIRSVNEEFNQALNTIFTEDNGLLPRSEHPPSDQVPKEYYFEGGHCTTIKFLHNKSESWECFLGGLGSAAFAPDEDQPLYSEFVKAARKVFNRFQVDEVFIWNIATEISFGYLAS